ncbi:MULTISPECIES: aldehyde dehydrogenase [unclassified Polaribacter]|jgi:aldehyde dehydrogenase (NAD+)|uniref:aldehyde dehydrogenase n=1 Tax=unclassified Polaribacter TaxID=196858 RepID=UPI001C4EA0F1|nr:MULTISPECIES: aldehyde dehydrogenase [unclassified Polaribacter]QXP64448.1 aldehyde dehydrogenase [Polaribacter sp. HaHaR_3_91]QXP66939.1 aldehyde dehydrogenase [Polaribacter sp. AHE13PA]
MKETSKEIILKNIAAHKSFFDTHKTKDISFRLTQLKTLKKAILQYQQKIETALWQDLHKSPEEAYLTEISIVIGEIDNHIKHIKKWAAPKRVTSPLHLIPASSKIIYEPLGTALIVAPWNYPFQLLINTLVGAISAGCCSVLKPSPDTPTVAKVMEEMILENFDSNYISVVHGGRETNTILFAQRFDIIFFTGSPKVGKVVMKAAAENLTPVVLELGGKSPCIVDADANIDIAAKRIIWGKLINAGQTCIAPDYLFAHESIKTELLDKIAENIKLMYGDDIKQSRFYPRIVNEDAVKRLSGLLNEGTIHTGGEIDMKEKFIAPTIIDNVQADFKIMQSEIFGPILPVMSFNHIDETIDYINKNEKPLAFYYFGKNKNAKDILAKTSSGGACINDTLMHVSNHNLPFGGVGNSGLGNYHGQNSFFAFSHKRAVVTNPTWIDLPLKYIPFKYFNIIKKLL